jgi:Protein of unknown function (DUF2490)
LKKYVFILGMLIISETNLFSQNRISDHNKIGWGGIFTTTKFNDHWSWHAEFQCRRVDGIATPQQNLFRTGINYQPNKKILFRLGYTNAETFPYGEYPLNSMGKKYSDNRIFEIVSISDKLNHFDLTHRFMLEQRFVGKYSSTSLTKEDEHIFVNRIRYMFRIQLPLQKKITLNHVPYVAMYDEIFIGFGKNVGENVFDQNRFGLLFGYKFNDLIKIEAGYLSQIVQLGREINNKNVFQYNGGLLLNTIWGFDLRKLK